MEPLIIPPKMDYREKLDMNSCKSNNILILNKINNCISKIVSKFVALSKYFNNYSLFHKLSVEVDGELL